MSEEIPSCPFQYAIISYLNVLYIRGPSRTYIVVLKNDVGKNLGCLHV